MHNEELWEKLHAHRNSINTRMQHCFEQRVLDTLVYQDITTETPIGTLFWNEVRSSLTDLGYSL